MKKKRTSKQKKDTTENEAPQTRSERLQRHHHTQSTNTHSIACAAERSVAALCVREWILAEVQSHWEGVGRLKATQYPCRDDMLSAIAASILCCPFDDTGAVEDEEEEEEVFVGFFACQKLRARTHRVRQREHNPPNDILAYPRVEFNHTRWAGRVGIKQAMERGAHHHHHHPAHSFLSSGAIHWHWGIVARALTFFFVLHYQLRHSIHDLTSTLTTDRLAINTQQHCVVVRHRSVKSLFIFTFAFNSSK